MILTKKNYSKFFLPNQGTKTQCTKHEECCQHGKEQIPSPGKKKVRRDSVNYSYGRFVWEYETAGIPITDDVMVDITIPRMTSVESPAKGKRILETVWY